MQERQIGGYRGRDSRYYRPVPRPAPAPAPSPLQELAPTLAVPARRLRPSKRRLWPLAAIITVLVIAVGVSAFVLLHKKNSPLPSSVASQVNFTPFLPTDGQGVTIDTGSYAWQQGVLTFTAASPDGSKVFVSEQAVPSNFDLTTFVQHIKSKQTLSNKYGQGTAGISENNLVVSEVADSTWIFMSAPVNTDAAQLGTVFQALYKY